LTVRPHPATAALLCAFAACALPPSHEPPPDVVLIVADDLGYGDLGCFGGRIPTPNLDRLAQQGARLTDFHVAQAVCGASRAAILTGCYPNRVGLFGAPDHTATRGIAARETTLADLLRARGYVTAIVGKWHLGHQPEFSPLRHGFDEWFGLPYSNDMWPGNAQRPGYYPPLPLHDGDAVVEADPPMDTLTTRYTERAASFVERHRGQPFFLYFAHTMPHVPLGVHPSRAGATGMGLYADVVHELDWSTGEILAALDRAGVADHTIVVFTSDNGPWLPYGDHAGSALPLREGKGTTFEGGIRVPCLLRWPGVTRAGSTVGALAATMDLLPTIAAAAGAPLPPLPIDGVDLRPALAADGNEPRTTLLCWWGEELQAVRQGRWKLHFAHEHRTQSGPPGRDGAPAGETTARIALALFDLDADPGERRDVAAQHPDVVAALEKVAAAARAELGDSATQTQGRAVRPADRAK
jgi:arylsulfatase A-like enzyme